MSFKEFGTIVEKAPEKRQEFPEFGTIVESEKSPVKQVLKETGRHVARTASRFGESLLGLPGDVLRTAGVGVKGLEAGASKIREKIGLSSRESTIKEPNIPGSQELKELSTKLFGEIVQPQSLKESFIDDIVSDASVLAIPIKGKIPFLRAIGNSIAGNVASKGAEQLGAGEKGQTAAKLGTFFLSSLTGKGNVKKFWNEQYGLAEKAIPKEATLDAFKLDRKLDKLSSELKKGAIETPSQKFVEKPLNELKKAIIDGELKVEDAVAAKKKINELRAGLFDEVKGSGGQKYARTKINDIANFLDESLETYGKENSKFYEHYKAANEAYAGFHQSKKVGKWINKAIPIGKLGKPAIILLEGLFKPAFLKSTIPAFAAFKGGELLTRMFKNSTLRNYYGNLMKSAINENTSGFLKNLKGMESEIKNSDPDIFDSLTSQDEP